MYRSHLYPFCLLACLSFSFGFVALFHAVLGKAVYLLYVNHTTTSSNCSLKLPLILLTLIVILFCFPLILPSLNCYCYIEVCICICLECVCVWGEGVEVVKFIKLWTIWCRTHTAFFIPQSQSTSHEHQHLRVKDGEAEVQEWSHLLVVTQ